MKAEDIEQSIKEIMLWESLQSNRREVAKVIHELKVKVSSLQSQLKEVQELLYKSKHNSQMSISEFEQFLYDRDKYLTQNKQDETEG